MAVTLLSVFGPDRFAPPVAAQAQVPSADIRLSGSVEERPPAGGITTGSEMRYRLTITNAGPQAVPADALSLVIFVDRSDSTQMATIEVSRFSTRGLKNIAGNPCGVGRHEIIRCTNRNDLEPDDQIRLDISHRHPAAIAGQLSFFAEVSPRDLSYIDVAEGNNAFGGPAYGFRDQATTTTTSTTSTTTTTDPSTSSTATTDPSSTTSSTSSSSSSTSSTTSSTTTTVPTTVSSTTSTTAPTTTTTAPTTTVEVTTSSIEAMVDSQATLVTPGSGDGSVLDATGSADRPDEAALLGPTAEDDDGPPYLLIGALVASLILLAGVGLAAYSYYNNQDPPLVDIRQYH